MYSFHKATILLLLQLFIQLLLILTPAKADFVMNKNCRDAYERIIALQMKDATRLIQDEKKINPQNDAVLYLENKALFLTAFITERKDDFEKLKVGKNEAGLKFEQGNPSNPYYSMAYAEVLMQTAVVKIKFREFISAALEIRKAYKLLEANKKKFPLFYPNLKGSGVLHALIGAVPDNYQWVVHLIGMEGNIRDGIGELRMLMNFIYKDPELEWLKEENLFLLLFTQHHLLKDDVATNELINRINMKNASPLLFFDVANYYNTTGQSAKTFVLMDLYVEKPGTLHMPYLDFMHGNAHLYNLDPEAEIYFKQYISRFSGQNFIRASYQKLAWNCFIQGDTSGYHKYLEMVMKSGNDFSDEDKQAQKEAESKELPNLYLLRSRLLFDGGYYTRALSELAGKKINDFPRMKDQIELTYRMGRIFDKTGQKEKANSYYETTYRNGQSQNWYFAANAALNIGLIYEEAKDPVNAILWYKKCLELRNHEYQNSIDQKAEAGLNRLTKH